MTDAQECASAALRAQAAILDTTREGVVLVDPRDHVVRLANRALCRMLGYGPDELTGRGIEPLFSLLAVQRKRLERSLRAGSGAGERAPMEFECLRKDGTRFVASSLLTLLDVDGREHWLAVLDDVTEHKRLEREVIEIASREQQRIGGDLHDGLGQDLTGVALMLKGVVAQLAKENSAARIDVEEIIGLVNDAIENVRALARGLTPVGGGRDGLGGSIQSLAIRAGQRFGLRVDFQMRLDEPVRLSEATATHIYRIVQEALTNVVRHSRATDVSIRLELQDGELQLRIDDNGQGFAQLPTDRTGGLGLKIMRYRARMLGGHLVIHSSGSGASVRCSCPLEIAVMEQGGP